MQKITIRGQELILHRQKSIYWQNTKTLIVADFHIGKSSHFRRNGIPAHSGIDKVNIKNLFGILRHFQPEHLIFLGDLFHNRVNGEWDDLKRLLVNFKSVSVSLVLGNHDILSTSIYDQLGLNIVPETLACAPFLFSHKPLDGVDENYYNLAGHVHPGIVLRGKGKQFVSLPCFCFSQNQGLMPAFGEFTGLAMIKPQKNDLVYVVTDSGVFAV